MKLGARKLLLIDRLFWPTHQFAEFLFKVFPGTPTDANDYVFVIKFLGMGSIVRFASLCDHHGVDKSKITMVTFPQHAEICALFGFTRTIVIRPNLRHVLRDCWNLFSNIRAAKPSLVIDYERCSHAVSTLRFGLAWWGKSNSISFEPNRVYHGKNLIVHDAEKITLEKLFLVGIERMAKAKSIGPSITCEINHYKVLININASDFLSARRYPMELFAEAIRKLHRQNNKLEFHLTGSAHEFEYVERLVSQLDGIPVFNKSGCWNLQELIHELSSCACFITGDSGPVHLSVFMGVPTIAVWGPTQPQHFGYDQVSHLHSLSLHLSCSPCFKHPASLPAQACEGSIDCLRNLPPDLIVSKVSTIIGEHADQRSVRFPTYWPLCASSNIPLVEQ